MFKGVGEIKIGCFRIVWWYWSGIRFQIYTKKNIKQLVINWEYYKLKIWMNLS